MKHGKIFITLLVGCFFFLQGCGKSSDVEQPVGFKSAKELREYFTWKPDRIPLVSAHRGGPVPGYAENAIRTFQRAIDAGAAIIECDVRLTHDGFPVLMHDKTLDRTTTGKGNVSDYPLATLKSLELVDEKKNPTGDKIPTLQEVLEWARDKAILHLDIKEPIEPSLIVAELQEANALPFSVVIVYNFERMMQYYHLEPELMLSVTAGSIESIKQLQTYEIPKENLKVFVGVSEPDPIVYNMLHDMKRYCILGTMHNLDNQALRQGSSVYQDLIKRGADILSTDHVNLAVEAIKTMP
ncbi:MAG: glycerophosphodiester phosphodiesterase family protein [Candidatus Marinimicrobia bacterium]|nr:glycerophosphodiester phosphodiesterase family protein [Candidatus Neomarinimicrobiota bacterium]MDD5581610.1 glycerophosphodiester phosphodiesterase family protein [Candidatus Neomarinimicrobiota bacterium]